MYTKIKPITAELAWMDTCVIDDISEAMLWECDTTREYIMDAYAALTMFIMMEYAELANKVGNQ